MAKHISKLLVLIALVIIIATAYYLQMNKVEGFEDSGFSSNVLIIVLVLMIIFFFLITVGPYFYGRYLNTKE